MTRRRPSTTGIGLPIAAALTTWASMLSWRGFSEVPSEFLMPLLVGGLLIGLLGAALRRLRLGGLWVFLGQVIAAMAFYSMAVTGSPVPVGSRWTAIVSGVEGAVRSAQGYAAPVPSGAPSLFPMLLGLGLVCLLLVDLVACTWRHVPLAGLVFLTIYSIPVSMLETGVPWPVFVLSAAGFLVMIFLHEDEQVSRWGRTLGPAQAGDEPGFQARTGKVRGSALGIGASATALAVVVPLLIPTLELSLLPGGTGPGRGKVKIENPMTDLRRDLRRGEDSPLLQVTTDDPAPTYLRISALTVFTNNEWRAGDREIPTDQRAQGELPPLVGVGPEVPREEFDYEVSAGSNFDSSWLPTMPQVSAVEAEGDWRYDRSTMDFLAAGDDTTEGLTWSMTGVDLALDAGDMAAAPPAVGAVLDYTELPQGFPQSVRDLAVEVTADQPSAYQRAVALQDWFRSDEFEYSIAAAEGNGSDELVEFLFEDRVGYCEQFASAMAAMARSLDIPARVAVGFLRPARNGPDTWVYSSHDQHAWPELYFPGYGWVRFEPTPGTRSGNAPEYTQQEVPLEPTDSGSASAGALPSAQPSLSASPKPGEVPGAESSAATGGSGISWRDILVGGLAVLLLVVVALTPRLVRGARRERRWTSPRDPEIAWAELRDTMTDLGLPWPNGLSPRATRNLVCTFFGPPPGAGSAERPPRGPHVAPEATAALDRIVLTLERHRYARPADESALHAEESAVHAAPSLRTDVETCAQALRGGVSRAARRRAEWVPRSVFRRTPRQGAPEAVRHFDSVVDQVS